MRFRHGLGSESGFQSRSKGSFQARKSKRGPSRQAGAVSKVASSRLSSGPTSSGIWSGSGSGSRVGRSGVWRMVFGYPGGFDARNWLKFCVREREAAGVSCP